jgi:hypothetical protein
MDDERRPAIRITADLPVHEVAVTDLEHSLLVGLDRRIQLTHGPDLPKPTPEGLY